MLVGNDVVDLRDPENQPDAIHARFDQRVFGPDERDGIREADSPHLMRWALWAAKESAFKVVRKVDPRAYFSPRAFAVRLVSLEFEAGQALLAEVRHAAGRFEVAVRGTDEWIHAVATVSGGDVAAVGWEVDSFRPSSCPGSLHREASERVRRLARSAVASALSLVPSDIVIAAAARRAPRVWARGRRLAVDLSMSHHGRFVACAWRRVAEGVSRRMPFADERTAD